jgi:hypothetical protein
MKSDIDIKYIYLFLLWVFKTWRFLYHYDQLFLKDNRLGVSLSLPDDGKRSSFRNVVFSGCLEFRTMDKVYKLSDSECYAPSSEPVRIYRYVSV